MQTTVDKLLPHLPRNQPVLFPEDLSVRLVDRDKLALAAAALNAAGDQAGEWMNRQLPGKQTSLFHYAAVRGTPEMFHMLRTRGGHMHQPEARGITVDDLARYRHDL